MLTGERLQHAHETLLPAIHAGKAVVCDRYVYSAAAHLMARGYAHEPWFLDLCRHLPRPSRLLPLKTKAEYEPEDIAALVASKAVERAQRCAAVARRVARKQR